MKVAGVFGFNKLATVTIVRNDTIIILLSPWSITGQYKTGFDS